MAELNFSVPEGHNLMESFPAVQDQIDDALMESVDNHFNPFQFILAGNAIFTIQSKKTGKRFTYKVNKLDDLKKDLWFVGVLTGSDNNADYTYLGVIETEIYDNNYDDGSCFKLHGKFRRTAKSTISSDSDSYKAFAWTFGKLIIGADIEKQADIFHEGRCGRCGRRLTVPESVKSGFGPECVTKVLG